LRVCFSILALDIRHAERMRRIILSSVPYVFTLSHCYKSVSQSLMQILGMW